MEPLLQDSLNYLFQQIQRAFLLACVNTSSLWELGNLKEQFGGKRSCFTDPFKKHMKLQPRRPTGEPDKWRAKAGIAPATRQSTPLPQCFKDEEKGTKKRWCDTGYRENTLKGRRNKRGCWQTWCHGGGCNGDAKQQEDKEANARGLDMGST